MKKGTHQSEEAKKKISKTRKQMRSWNDGSEKSKERIEQCRKMGKFLGVRRKKGDKGLMGANNPNWKGGSTNKKELDAIRKTWRYRVWKKAVLERDQYLCIWCGAIENLQADHILPFSKYPELRFEISNGRTLCFECHKNTETFGGKLSSLRTKKFVEMNAQATV